MKIKKLLFKILTKYFYDEIIDMQIQEELPSYDIKEFGKQLPEKLADLYQSPEYKIFAKLQANKKNYLGKILLSMKYSNAKEAHIKHAKIQGQAYAITHSLNLIKYYNKLHQRSKLNKK